MTPCRSCVEKGIQDPCWVPEPIMVCCDCAFPTPRDRQRKLGELEWSLTQAQESLRDKFAMAALTGLLSSEPVPVLDPSAQKGILLRVATAFAYADEALKHRKA